MFRSPDVKDAVGSCEPSEHQEAFTTLADLRHWIDKLSDTDQRSAPVCRVREALSVLELDASRDVRQQLQQLLKPWGIGQKSAF